MSVVSENCIVCHTKEELCTPPHFLQQLHLTVRMLKLLCLAKGLYSASV